MTKNNILKIEIVLKEYGLTNLGIVIFNNRFLKKYEIAMLIGPDEPFFWDIFLWYQKDQQEKKKRKKNNTKIGI